MTRIQTVVGATLALAVSAEAQSTVPGWTLTMRMSIDSGNGNPTTFSMRMLGAGKKMRQELGARGMAVASIANGEDGTVTAVMEEMGMAVVTRSASLAGLMPKSSVTNAKSEKTDLGAEVLNGVSTRHARIALSVTSTQTYNGYTCSRPQTMDLEVWTVSDSVLPRVLRAMAAASASLASSSSLGMDESAQLMAAAGAEGAVKTIIRESWRGRAMTMTMEYADYALKDVDVSALSVPPGLNVQDMGAIDMNGMMGSAMQTAVANRFWSQFDTTAAAGVGRATCTRQ
jgi:hypothetical protein